MASKLRLTPLIKDKEVLGQEQVSNEALPIMQDKTKPKLRLTSPDMPNVKSAPMGGTVEGFNEVDFSELDRDIAPDQNIEAQLAQTQSGWELFGKAAARSAAEIGFGTLEGFSYLLDWEQAADYAAGDEQEFSNWFADLMKQGKEAVREATPIYQTESAQEGFAPFDSTWWASNADSIVSTISMMVPAYGAVKGLSLAGKGVRALMGASKAAKAAKTVKKGSELIQDINKVLGSNKLQNVLSGVSQATVSRYMENTMEAAETYQSTLQELVGQGMSEEDAKTKAGEAARTSWGANWVNLAFDVAQYMTLTKGPSIANFANKELRKGLLAKAGDYLGGMAQEAAEEGIQFVVAEEAKRSAVGNKPFLDLKGFGARMSDYLSDPEMQSAMFLGAFGGGLFQAVGSGANKIQGLVRNEEAYLATVLSLDKGDIATAHQVQDTRLLEQAYAYARAGKLGDLKSFYQEMADASDADLLAKGMSMEEIVDKRERDSEILADIDFVGNEYARIYDNADLSEQQKADELSHLHQKNTNNRTLEKINKKFEEAKTKALKEGLTTEQFDFKVNKFRLSILEDTLKQEEKNAEELGNEGLVKSLKQRIEKAKEAIKTSEEALKEQGLPTDQVPTSTADGSLFGDNYNTGNFGTNGLVFQQEQLGVNNDYIDSLLQTIGEPDYLEKRERQVQNENLEQALALVNHKTPLSVLDKILKSDNLNEENKKKVQEKVDQLTEANNNVATIPTNEATKEEDIKKRYASSLTLKSDLSKISERGGDIAGVVNGETFANKYANNAEFKKIVDELYSDLQKERSTNVDTNTPTPVDTPTPTNGNPITGGNSESVVDYGVNESNIARSNQHVLYTYEGDGKFSVTGLKDSEGNIISSKKLVTKDFLEAELSAIYGRDVKLSYLRGTEEYESPGPYILRETDNTPVAHTFNTIKAKTDGVTQPFITEADFDVLNDPDVKISGNPVKLRYLLDYEFGPDQQNAQNAMIALVVEHEGKEYTVGSLPRVEGSPDTEMNRKVAAMRENLFKEWQASGQTSGVFEGSEAVTVKGRTNGEYNRSGEFSFNPIDILGPNEPLFYGTVKGKDKNGDVIIDTNKGEQIFKEALGIDIRTTFKGQSLLSNYPGQTVLFIRGASGLYLPAYMQAMPLSNNQELTKEVMDLLDEFAADVKTAKNDQEISRIQDNINAELSKYIAFAVQYNKETGNFQEVFKASQTSSSEVSEAMSIEALKTLAQNKKMRVDSKKINTSVEYNRQMAEEGRFKIDILPGFKTIGARVKLDLSTVKVTPKAQPATTTQQGSDTDLKRQEELENKVKEVKEKRKALRGEDGTVPKENMAEFKQLGKDLDVAQKNAQRGNLPKGFGISIRLRGEKVGDDTTIATGIEAKRHEIIIERIIQKVLSGKTTAQQAMEQISSQYAFAINEMDSIAAYINDRTSDAPEIGNNKQSFAAWRKGEFDTTTAPTTPVENVLTDSQKKNLEAAKENKKVDPAEKKFNTIEDALAHAESLRGKSFDVNGQKVEFVEYRDNIITGAGQRVFIKVKINGVPVTFYSSTGKGKKALQEGVFYPVLGVEADARFNGTWINKIGGAEMASYNNSAALASVGAFIDSNFGNLNDFANEITGNTVALQNPTGEALSREKGLELRKEYNFEYLNSGRETYSNNEGSKVKQAFKDLVAEVNNSLQEAQPTTAPTTEGTVEIPVNDMTIVYNPQTGEMTFKTTGNAVNETVGNKALVRYETTQGTIRNVELTDKKGKVTKYAVLSDGRVISLNDSSVGKQLKAKGLINKILEQAGEAPTPVQPTQQTSEVEVKKVDIDNLLSKESTIKIGRYTPSARFSDRVSGENVNLEIEDALSAIVSFTRGPISSKQISQLNEVLDLFAPILTLKKIDGLISKYENEIANFTEIIEGLNRIKQDKISKQAQQTTEETTTVPKKKTVPKISIKRGRKGGKNRLADPTQEYEVWNEKEELGWFKKNYPGVPIEVLDDIREVIGKGGPEAWGLFHNASVFIQSNAAKGTAYHEAFHVVFNLMLTEKERNEILKAGETFAKGAINIEEHWADKFMQYQLAEGKVAETFPAKVADFFKRLWHMIRIAGERMGVGSASMNDYMYRVSKGLYAKKAIQKVGNVDFKRNITRFSLAKNSYEGVLNPSERPVAKRLINGIVIEDVLPWYRDELLPEKDGKDYSKLDDKETLAEIFKRGRQTGDKRFTIQGIYETLYEMFEESMSDEDLNDLERDQLQRTLDTLATKADDPNTGEATINFTPFLAKVVQGLSNYGVNYNIYSNTASNSTFTEGDAELMMQDEDVIDNWMVKEKFIGSFEKFNQKANRLFASVYGSSTFGGYTTFEDPNNVKANLIHNISGSNSIKEMMKKLEELKEFKRNYDKIYKTLQEDTDLRKEFFINIGQRENIGFMMMQRNNDGTAGPFMSNRKNLKGDIVDNLRYSLMNSVHYNPTEKNYSVPNIDKHVEVFNDIREKYKNEPNESNLSQEDVDKIKEIVKDLELAISDSELDMLFTETTEGVKNGLERFRLFSGMKNGKGFSTLLDSLQKGQDPFYNEDIESFKSVQSIAESLVKVKNNMYQPSFTSSKGEKIYSVLQSRFMFRHLNMLTKLGQEGDTYIDGYLADPFFKNSPFLNKLKKDSAFRALHNFVVFDGLRKQGQKNAKEYSELTPQELEAVNINAFFNTAREGIKESSTGYYMMPVLSDSTSAAFLKSEKLSEREALNNIIETAKQEYERVKFVKKMKANGTTDTLTDSMMANGDKFQLFPFLNGKDLSKTGALESLVREEVKKLAQSEYDKLIEDGVLIQSTDAAGNVYLTDPNGIISNDFIAGKDGYNNVMRYLMNNMYMNMQTLITFGGDAAYYKGKGAVDFTDVYKRIKEIWSPGDYIGVDPNAEWKDKNGNPIPVNETYNVSYIKDPTEVEKIRTEHKDAISDIFPGEANKGIRAAYGVEEDPNSDGLNNTDAATWIDIVRLRDIEIGAGRWNDNKQEVFNAIMNGEKLPTNAAIVFNPIKPFQFVHKQVEHADGTITQVPTQHKNAEMLLTPDMAIGNPKLKEILEKMGYEFVGNTWSYDPAKRVTDAVMFTSAVKVGRYNVENNIKDISTDNTISMRNEDYRIQMPTPEHHLDTDILFGTQLRKILMNINLEKMYKTPEGEMFGQEIFDKYQEAMALNIKESYDELRKIFYNKDGSVNKEKLMLALREEASNRELGEDIEEAFEWLDDNKNETVLPMWHPHIATRVEAMMYSFFKNRVTKQRTSKGSGMAVFNTTSYGFSKNNREGLRKPQIKFNKDRSINHYEALLPAHLKSLERYADENGIIDVNNVPEDVRKGIFYRIPTEDFYSVFHIKVIGYLPASAGGQIVLPDEVTTIAGLDFDIDKLFGMMYNLQKVYNNEERKTELEVLLKEFPEASEDFPEMMELLKSDEGQTYKNRYESKEPIVDFVDGLVGKKINTVKPEYSFILDQNTANLIKTYIDKVGIDQIKVINESTYKGLKGEDVTAKKKLKAVLTMYNSALKPEKYDQALSRVREAIAAGKTKKQLIEELKGELMNYELAKVPSGMGSKEARDNMILDMAYNVLSSRNTTENQLRPGNFDKLKMMSNGVQLLRPKTDTSLNPMLPSTRREVFERNMTGNGLIGIFANHNANQMLTVHGNFRFGLSLDINNSKGLNSLSRHEVNGVRITNTLAEFLAAAVDNAKDPVFSFLNITSATADWAATMTRTGVSIETATAMMATPPMVKMTKYLNKEGRSDDATIAEALDSIRDQYLKELQKRYAEQERDPQDAIVDYEEYRKQGYAKILTLDIANKGENTSDYTGSIADLIRTEGKDLSKINDKQLSDAMLVIDYMQKVITNSGALKPTVAAMRFDSVSAAAKPSIAENIDVEKKKQTAINKGKTKLKSGEVVLTGFEQFMSEDSPIPYVNMFYEYGVEKANEIVKDVTGIPYADPNSIFNGVANWIATMSKREGGLDAKDKNRIYRAVMTVISSGYTTYTPQELETITKELPSKLDKYLKQNPDSPYRMLLLRFISKPSENVQGVDVIEFNNSGLTDAHKQDLKDIWKAMLYSSKEEDVQLAKDLAKYSFSNSGYVFGPTSFSDLIPTRYISELHDNPNISYTDYLKNEFERLAGMTDLTARANMITGITDQVIRNFFTTLPIPNITLGKDNLSLKRDENNDIHIEIDMKKVPNMIIVENIANPNNTSQQDIEPSKYLKTTITDPITKISRPVLFQKTGLNDKNGNVIYKAIPRLGLNNEIVETDYSLVDTTTPLLSRIHNYVTKTVPVVKETQKASPSELGNAVGEMIADSSSDLADSVRNYDETSPVDPTHPAVIAVKRMNPEEQTNTKETIDNKPDITPEVKETFNEIVEMAEETVEQEVAKETVAEEQQLPAVPETVVINGVTIDTGNIKLNEQQYAALQSMADFIDSTIQGEINDQTISYTLQGYAGTGKTTITKFLIDYVKGKRKAFEITSPTHRAKEVLMDKTKEQAMTLQKALGLSPGVELEKFTLDDKYFISKTDPKLPARGVFIVDEASMINDDLYQMIIREAKVAGSKVIFIGDDAQLKPVKQRTKAKAFQRENNISRLTQVMRTADGNPMPSQVLQPIRNNPSSNVDMFDHVDNLSDKGEGIIFTNSKEEWENMMLSEFNLQELVDNPNKVRVLAFTNNRVAQLNTMIRNQMFGYQPEPFYEGEMMMMYENLFYNPATQDYDYSNGSDVIVRSIRYKEDHMIRSPFSGKSFKVAGYQLEMLDAKKGTPKANSLFVADINMVNPEYLQELEDLKDAANKASGRQRGMLWAMHFKLSAAYNLTVPVYKIKGRIFTDQNQARKYLAENKIDTNNLGRYKVKDKSLDYAYAHTIHKSQGGTYDKAFVDENDIDRARTFKNPDHEFVNQLKYVGFSRSSQLTVSLSSKAAQKASQQKPVEPAQTQEELPADMTNIDEISDLDLDFEGVLSQPIETVPQANQPTQQINDVEVVLRYSNADAKANPDKIYVFGDNTQRTGTGGQAQIRNNENAFGIATKLKPNNSAAAFMSDNDLQSNKDVIDSDIAKIKADGRPLVFPKDGIGTGLAKLKEKAPQTYAYLKQKLLEEFGFNNDTGDVSQPTQQAAEPMRKVAINQQTLDKINANFASFGMPPVSIEWFNTREPEEQQMIMKCYGK